MHTLYIFAENPVYLNPILYSLKNAYISMFFAAFLRVLEVKGSNHKFSVCCIFLSIKI